jgi:tryptophanyl-tRNA synthetase
VQTPLLPKEAFRSLDVPKKGRVLSGMRPTGRLHIGHYFGALQNWVKLQEQYDCFYFVADWHALTTDYADSSQVSRNTLEIATDWLASGLSPENATLFVQSHVPEHAELHLLLSMVTPLGWLERVPTYKEQLEQIKDKDLHTYGFLGYPLLQTADIVIYGEPGQPLFVPVGEDQVPHVEMSREVVRRFNTVVGFGVRSGLFEKQQAAVLSQVLLTTGVATSTPVQVSYPVGLEEKSRLKSAVRMSVAERGIENYFVKYPHLRKWFYAMEVLREPDHLLTETPRLPGTDGRKMSKSYGNFISLSEGDAEIREKVRNMMTDPARKRRTDPGNPDVCPVFHWHKVFSPQDTIDRVNRECRTAEIGCVDCKKEMAENLVRWIAPMRARREEYEAKPQRVMEILDEGSEKARQVAKETMTRVREAFFGNGTLRKEMGAAPLDARSSPGTGLAGTK